MTPQAIKELRQRMGLTQEQFASKVGTTFVSINRWESGKVKPSRMFVKELMRLAARAI